MKGSIRSILEAVSDACVSQVGPGEKPLVGKRGACRYEHKGQLCVACRVFGTTGYRGRVSFADARPVGKIGAEIVKIADLWRPRRAVAGRRFYWPGEAAARADDRPERGHRLLEVVPRGSRFGGAMAFENLAKAELSLLIHAMGLAPGQEFSPKIGGAKPRCFGAVTFHPVRLCLCHDDSGPGKRRFPGVSRTVEGAAVAEYLVAATEDTSLLRRDSWRTFVDGMRVSRGRTCPGGIY